MATDSDTLPGEEWRDVIGYEGVYQVSSIGRVRRLASFRNAGGGRRARVPENTTWGYIGAPGYPMVCLGKFVKKYVHRLVCEAFHGPAPEGKKIVAHFDGDKTNNRAENLRWASHADNRKDGKRLGEILTGERHGMAILTEADVHNIRKRRANGDGVRQIGRDYGICHQHVGDIIRRRIWKDI